MSDGLDACALRPAGGFERANPLTDGGSGRVGEQTGRDRYAKTAWSRKPGVICPAHAVSRDAFRSFADFISIYAEPRREEFAPGRRVEFARSIKKG